MMGIGGLQKEVGSILNRHGYMSMSIPYRSMTSFLDGEGNLNTEKYLSHKRIYRRQEILQSATKTLVSGYQFHVTDLAKR